MSTPKWIGWILLLGLPLWGEESPLQQLCTYCHGGEMELSKLRSLSSWSELIRDRGRGLQAIHHDNLGVVAYLQSDRYDEKALYDIVAFFARRQIEIDADRLLGACSVCHNNRIELSKLWSKRQWRGLTTTLKPLQDAHRYEQKVLRSLSSLKQELIAEMVKELLFFAPKRKPKKRRSLYVAQTLLPQKSVEDRSTPPLTKSPTLASVAFKTLTKPHTILHYDVTNLPQSEAEEIVRGVEKALGECPAPKRTYEVTLYHNRVESYGTDMALSILFVGVLPVRYAHQWVLEIATPSTTYTQRVEVVKVAGGIGHMGAEDEERLQDKISSMIDPFITQGCR